VAELRIPELALSEAWHGQRFAGPLRTVDGRSVEVVFRGTWTHGFGPDFRDATIVLAGREIRTGSVEVHLRTSAWSSHGHGSDPRYDDVVLHVVLHHDGAETRRRDGALVPVVELGDLVPTPLLATTPASGAWDQFGGEVCAAALARRDPARIRAALWRLGDARLATKAAKIEARLTGEPPAGILYTDLLDGLGYHANREPMRSLARRLPLAALESAMAAAGGDRPETVARALLFGVAGFLPLAPADAAVAHLDPAEVAAMEAIWRERGGAWRDATLPPTAWTRARVRPANHPVARLAAAAALLANTREGLAATLLGALRADHDPVATLRDLTWSGTRPGIGDDRATAIVASAVLPFALAVAEQTGDGRLLDAAARAWERLPAAAGNHLTRRATRQVAGDLPLGRLGSRGQQGLIHLDAALCAPRRCYECPIAHAVMTDGASPAVG
jgi:hypothetical protein